MKFVQLFAQRYEDGDSTENFAVANIAAFRARSPKTELSSKENAAQ
jgi:hypothetical protein